MNNSNEVSKMLINAIRKDELRIAVLKGNLLSDFVIEYPGIQQKRSNIYKGRITRIEPSLEAAFVDYGAERQGFLPLKEIPKIYFSPGFSGDLANVNIRDVLREGQELIVQVEKEERGNKGAALTGFISIPGAYVVLMPNNPRAGGISRRIEGQERDDARDKLPQLNIPDDMGVIIRTAGIGKSLEDLQWDLDILLRQWSTICQVSSSRPAPFLIYQEGDSVTRTIRDHLRHDLSEIIVDSKDECEKVRNYIQLVKPEFVDKVKLEDEVPLFSKYQIEHQIETLHKREVRLPSGGAIVIDHTEALVSIDVNSAKATGGSDIEETARNTNLEAVQEIARQLRLRDIGGLIVIDFIDMTPVRNQMEVSQSLKDALQYDRARVQVGKISSFGLLEMSRQRLRPHLGAQVQITCPRCDGQGSIRSIESLTTSIIHLIEEEATKEKVAQVNVQVPIDLATFLLNEKKELLAEIQNRQQVRIYILPNQHLVTPDYKIRSFRKGDSAIKDRVEPSYKYIEETEMEMPEKQEVHEKVIEKPAIDPTAFAQVGVSASVEKGAEGKAENVSGLMKLVKKIFGIKEVAPKVETTPEKDFTYKGDKRRMRTRYRRPPKGKPRRSEDRRGTGSYSEGQRGGSATAAQQSQKQPQSQQQHRRQPNKRGVRGSFSQDRHLTTPPYSNDYPEAAPGLTPIRHTEHVNDKSFSISGFDDKAPKNPQSSQNAQGNQKQPNKPVKTEKPEDKDIFL